MDWITDFLTNRVIGIVLLSVFTYYLTKNTDRLLARLFIINKSKRIKNMEYEIEKITKYHNNKDLLYMDIANNVINMIALSVFIICFLVFALSIDSKSDSVFYAFLSITFICLLGLTHTYISTTISHVKNFDSYLSMTKAKLRKLNEHIKINIEV